MAYEIPKISKGWELRSRGKGWDGLSWNSSQTVRALNATEVLVKFHAASLNYRDLAVANGTYPLKAADGIVPGSDGAGEIIAVGDRVTRFRTGDKVLTYVFQTGYFGSTIFSPEAELSALGGTVDGAFREYGIFDQEGLVHMPSNLSFEQGAALGGAYVTAWNVLTGGANPVRPGDCVLVQGSGGVSIAVLQLAVAAGVSVIATTSSKNKADKLTELGASHVINYNEDAVWGATAKALSPRGQGCSHVVDVIGSPDSFRNSLDAVALGGEIQVVGFLDAAHDGSGPVGPTFLDSLMRFCAVRGIPMGSRNQLEEMVRAVESKSIKPVLDDRVFDLDHLPEAYQYMHDRKHFGKVVIKINQAT